MNTLCLKRNAIAAAIGIAGTIFAGSAGAYTWSLDPVVSGQPPFPSNGLMSLVAGATTITFDAASLPTGVTYTGGAVTQGFTSGVSAPPQDDTSKYFTVGPTDGSPGSFNSTFLNRYFGFNLSSPDTYNSLEFLRGGNVLISYTGTTLGQVMGFPADGVQTTNRYLNVYADNAGEYFDQVRFSSTRNAFETDNHAFIAVPEPETYAMMLAGLGLMGFIARRRKQNAVL